MDYDALVEATRTVRDTPNTAGIVLSRKAWADLKRSAPNDSVEVAAKTNEVMPLMSTPLYPFSDVPDRRLWLFYDRDLLTRYLKLRDEVGHKAAIQRVTANVEDELVIEAEIRALIEQS